MFIIDIFSVIFVQHTILYIYRNINTIHFVMKGDRVLKYSLLIVDENKNLREDVGKYIENVCNRVNVSGSFSQAVEVIDYIENNDANIIIIDTELSGMSGLELAKYLSVTKPDINVIIFSNDKKFEYAIEAMKYNVTDYIVKSNSYDGLLSAVEISVKKLDSEHEVSSRLNHYSEIIGDMRSKFFLDLTVGALGNDSNIEAEFNRLGFSFDYNNTGVYVCSVAFPDVFYDTWSYGRDGAATAIMNFLNKSEYVLYSTKIDDDLYVLISHCEDISPIKEQIIAWTQDALKTDIDFQCNFSSVGIKKLQNYSLMNVKNFGEIEDSVKIQIFKLMNSYLSLGMIENARELFRQLSSELTEDNIRELVDFLYSNIYIYDNSFKSPGDSIPAQKAFEHLCEHVRKSSEREDMLIQKIKEFINKNYASDITLESVANKVYLHSVYVSRYFKQHTGTNFSDYLFSVRMTHAIDLLKTNKYKISKVGEMVGYKNYKYFSKQFKNYTGFTPKRYFREVWFVNVNDDE